MSSTGPGGIEHAVGERARQTEHLMNIALLLDEEVREWAPGPQPSSEL